LVPVFSPDGKILATWGADGLARLWAPAGGEPRLTFRGQDNAWVTGVAFSADGKTLVTTEGHPFALSLPARVRIRAAADGRERLSFEVPGGGAYGCDFTPDSRTFAVGGNSGVVILRDVATGAVRATFHGHTKRVMCVAFSPDGRTLAAGGYDRVVRLWR